jgi:hypothetical protein
MMLRRYFLLLIPVCFIATLTLSQTHKLLSERIPSKQHSPEHSLLRSTTNSMSFSEVFVYDLGTYLCGNDIASGDFDNDTDIDILLNITSANAIGRNNKIILLRNNGNSSFTASVIDSISGNGYKVYAADFNNSGSLDFVVCSDRGTSVYLNDGDGHFTYKSWSDGSWGYGGLACADLDLDGDIDIVRGFQGTKGGFVKTYLNDGIGYFTPSWTSAFYGSANGTITNVALGRVNSDRYPDIIASEIYDGIGIEFSNNDTGKSFTEMWKHNFGTRVFGLSTVLFNSDSLSDALFNVGWGSTYLFDSYNDTLERKWQSHNNNQASFNVSSGNFNGDNRQDVFIETIDGLFNIYNNADGDSLVLSWTDSLISGGYSGYVADINMDGLSDLIVGEANKIRVWLNTTNSTAVNDPTFENLPIGFRLDQNYPNPFNPTTTIRFSIPSQSFVSLKVFDGLGREVSILLADELPAGTYARQWNASNLPSGFYFYRLQSNKFSETKKLILLK